MSLVALVRLFLRIPASKDAAEHSYKALMVGKIPLGCLPNQSCTNIELTTAIGGANKSSNAEAPAVGQPMVTALLSLSGMPSLAD